MKIKKVAVFVMIFIMTMNSAYGQNTTKGIEGDILDLSSTKIINYSIGYNKYTNNPFGYELVLPNYLELNEDKINVKSTFSSKELVVEILYDNFENTLDTIDSYNNYGNLGIKRNAEFEITSEYNHKFNNEEGYITLYQRRKLNNDEQDKNYYATISFPRTSKEVVTVFMKSSKPIYIEYIMPKFEFINKTKIQKKDKTFQPEHKKFDIKTQEFYNKYFIENEKVDFGIFEPTFPTYKDRLFELETMFNYNFPVTLTYNSFELPFKKEFMNNAKEEGKVVEYTLYTTDKVNGTSKDITLDILDGKYDSYLNHLADNFNEYDYPVLFRINNEMNGSWVLYSSYFVGKDTDLFTDCYRYIYDKFQEKNVNNLIFVWNPNEISYPNYAYNHYLSYYPGNKYVDIIGLTAYNTGTYYSGEIWRKFEEAYDDFYYDYTEHFTQPMMITEYSCSSTGGDKSAWFTDMFKTIDKYDKIKLAVLWNGQDFDMTKPNKPISRNYRLDKDQSVIQALKTGFQKFK